MKAIEQYAKHFAAKKAEEKILEDLKQSVLSELRRVQDGKYNVHGVEFHLTAKATRRYPKDIKEILDNLQSQIDEQKKVAEEAGKVKISKKETFDASIPKSTEVDVLSKIKEYAKYFGKGKK